MSVMLELLQKTSNWLQTIIAFHQGDNLPSLELLLSSLPLNFADVYPEIPVPPAQL